MDFYLKDLVEEAKEDKIIKMPNNINLGNVIFEITDGTYKSETFTVQEPIKGGGARKIKTKTKNNTVKKLMGGAKSAETKEEDINYKKSGVDVDGFNVYSRETLLQEEIAYVEAQQNFNQAKLKVGEEREILITELNNIVPDLKNNIINAVKTAVKNTAASDKAAAAATKAAADKAAEEAAATAAAAKAVEEVKNKAQNIATKTAEAIVTAGYKEITVAKVAEKEAEEAAAAAKVVAAAAKVAEEAVETKVSKEVKQAVSEAVKEKVLEEVKQAVQTKLKKLEELIGITLNRDLNLSELEKNIEKLSKELELKEIEEKKYVNDKIQEAIKAKAEEQADKTELAKTTAETEADNAAKEIVTKTEKSEEGMFNNYKTALKDYIRKKIDYEIKKQIADDAKLKRGSSKTGLAISLIQVDGIYGIKLANEDIILFTQDGVDYSNKLKIFSIPDRPYSIFNYYITSLINGANDVLPLFKKFMKYYFIISKRVQPQESNYKNLLKKLEEGGFEPTELYSQIQELFTKYPREDNSKEETGQTRIDTLYNIKLELFPNEEGDKKEDDEVKQANVSKKLPEPPIITIYKKINSILILKNKKKINKKKINKSGSQHVKKL